MVVAGLLFAGVVPARTWLAQRDAIAAEEARLRVLRQENERLTARVDQLHTGEEIERLAREQYQLVRPGEEAYAILPAPEVPAPPAPAPQVPSPGQPIAQVSEPAEGGGLLEQVLDRVLFWRE